ncbi:MAG: nucleotidyltransferase domain-containing protein [Alphaproteobacteria bacterium]
MTEVPDARLQRLLERIVTTLHPEVIYLFGSRTRGDAKPDSDYDLLVVVSDDSPESSWSLHKAACIPRDPGVPADVIPCRRSVFERRRAQVGTLSYQAAREGRLVYGA